MTHVFVQACEWSEDIDAARAAVAERRIMECMRQQRSRVEYQWSKIALTRAMPRQRITQKRYEPLTMPLALAKGIVLFRHSLRYSP